MPSRDNGRKKKKRISKELEEKQEQSRGWKRWSCSTAELRLDNPAWEGRSLTEATFGSSTPQESATLCRTGTAFRLKLTQLRQQIHMCVASVAFRSVNNDTSNTS